MKARQTFFALLAALVILTVESETGLAETEFRGYQISGEAALGFLEYADRPDHPGRGKLEEYRDLSPGVIEALKLQMLDKSRKYLYEVRAFNASRDDQNYYLRVSRSGTFNFEFEWDQIPHLFSTASPFADEIKLRWDKARVGFTYTPTPEWDIDTEYIRIEKSGELPKGLSLGFFPNLNFIEVLQPVEQTQHELKMAAALAREKYQFQISYDFQHFDNDLAFINVPFNGLAFDPRAALAPDNSAHIVSMAGGVNLPYKTRVNSTFSYGLRLQSENFIQGNFAAPPQNDLNGMVNTFLFNLTGTSHPLKPLTVKASYRMFHFDDQSDELLIGTAPALILAERSSYTKHTAGVDAKWKFDLPLSANAGFKWQRWDRDEDVSEVAVTDEYTPSVALDYNPFEWMQLRAAYSHSSRFGSTYRVLDIENPDIQQLLLRKFNMADRERDRLDFTAEFNPVGTLVFSANFGLARDNYTDSPFGLLDDNYWAAGADVSWRPVKRVALSLGYLHEEYNTRQLSGSEIDIDPGTKLITDDSIDTFSAGAKISIVPEKVDLDIRSTVSYALTNYNNAVLPHLWDSLNQNRFTLSYKFKKHWMARLGYIFEVYDRSDAYTQVVALPDPNIFLGDFYKDYTAHIIVGTLAYQF